MARLKDKKDSLGWRGEGLKKKEDSLIKSLDDEMKEVEIVKTPGHAKWPCKKLKGQHDFSVLFERHESKLFSGWRSWCYEIWKCQGCGKRKYKTIK